MRHTLRPLIVAGCTVSLLGLGVSPANADVITPGGTTVTATADCIPILNRIELMVRPDPEAARIRVAITSSAGQIVHEDVAGTSYLDWRQYTFNFPELGTSDNDMDWELWVQYLWDVNGELWTAEETLPTLCNL